MTSDFMRVDLFDFELPETSIALRPAEPRDAARMLVVRPRGRLSRIGASATCRTCCGRATCWCSTTPRSSRRGSTAFACARRRPPRVEIMLHKRESADRWRAFARPAKKLAVGDRIRFGESCREHGLRARCASMPRSRRKARAGEVAAALLVLRRRSSTRPSRASANCRCRPTSPASGRPTTSDRADYQTIYARDEGAVAAPTAGLHFTADALPPARRARRRPPFRDAARRAPGPSCR